MEEEFVYWRHPTLPGIKVEEVTGGARYRGELWLDMARQVYCENGREAYRDLCHYANGAPFLAGENSRISLTHCAGLLAVATLPPTPEADLAHFSERAAVGIDAERSDRSQVLRIRGRFLSDAELDRIPADDVTANVTAWTVKEAAYKAAFLHGLDFRRDIMIDRMPVPGPPTPVFDPSEFGLPASQRTLPGNYFGEVRVMRPDSEPLLLKTYSYMSEEFVITLCYSPRCAKFGKNAL